MNPNRSRLEIFLRDLIRWPYNAIGLWLLRQRLAWPYYWAALKRKAGRPGVPPAAPPPIGAFVVRGHHPTESGSAAGPDRVIPIFPAARVPRPTARTFAGARPPWRLHRYANRLCAPAYVAGLANAQYHAPAHDIFSAKGWLLPEFSFYGPENWLAEGRGYARRYPGGLPPTQPWPGVTAALAAHFGEWNYFHWMLQVLPRLELLRLAGIHHDQIDRYLLHTARFPFHTETLARLGVPAEKVVATGPDTHFRAEYLWTTSSLRLSGHINHWVADFLRREFLAATPPAGGERIFIGRGDATRRRMLNEPEIAARLERLGFRSVTAGQMLVAEQASLLAGAQVVVAPHGAGLTNLVFARPGTKVLELHSPTRRGMVYWELSNARQLDYYYLIGEDMSSGDDPQGFRVPLAELNALLETAGVR